MLMLLLFLCLYTLVILALLKRFGWITINPQNVRSNQIRQVFLMALQLGDIIVAKSLDLIGAVYARRGNFGRGGYGTPGFVGPANGYEQRVRREEPPFRPEGPYQRQEPTYPPYVQ